MIRKVFLESITALLVVLFVYTALSKLLDVQTFSEQMRNQPLPLWIADILVWAIPSMELVISVLLLISSMRIYGLLSSLLLLLAFTIYVGMVYLNFFERVPCSCGGFFRTMSWETHLVFNLGLTLLAITGIYLEQMKPLQFQET